MFAYLHATMDLKDVGFTSGEKSPTVVSAQVIQELKQQVDILRELVEQTMKQQNSSIIRDGIDALRHQFSVVKQLFNSLFDCLTWRDYLIISSLLVYIGYRFLKVDFNFKKNKPVKVVPATAVTSSSMVMESRREGSEESNMMVPKFQFQVGDLLDDGTYCVHGCGVRIEDCLVLPDHVYSQCDRAMVRVSGKKEFLDLKAFADPKHLDTDLLYIDMRDPDDFRKTRKELSMMGLSKPTICHELEDCGTLVNIVGCMGKGTTGMLVTVDSPFGHVEYSGTTVVGYSGAAYCKGDQLAGIHTYGGVTNGGYSASYVDATLHWLLNKCKESDIATETFRNWHKRGKKFRYDPSWGDLDTMRISIGGKVRIVDRSKVQMAFPGEEFNAVFVPSTFQRRGRQMQFKDHTGDLQMESINFPDVPRKSMDLSMKDLNEKLDTKKFQLLMSVLDKCSQLKLKKMESLLNSNIDQPSGSGRITPTSQS